MIIFCNSFHYKTFTPLSCSSKIYTLSKRFFPGNNQSKQIIVATQQLIPRPPVSTALVQYNPIVTQNFLAYRNSSNPRLAVQLDKYCKESSKPKIDHKTVVGPIKPVIQKVLDYVLNIEPNINHIKDLMFFINGRISTERVISQEYLSKILQHLNRNNLPAEQQEQLMLLLRRYFEINLPTLENARMFLEIWDKGNYKFRPLRYNPVKENIIKKEENNPDTMISTDNIVYIDKKEEVLNKIKTVCNMMKLLFIEYKDDPEKIIYSKNLALWINHIETRGSVIPLQPEEISIYDKLEELKKKYIPKEEELLKSEIDRLKVLKDNSSLPVHLQKEALDKCYLPEDYDLEIKNIKEIVKILHNNNISQNDLKLLSINSSATTIDQEGVFKIAQEAYKSFTKHANALGFKYLNNYPEVEHIISQIRDKKFVIVNNIPPAPGSIVSVAHLSHKTLIVPDEKVGRNVLVRTGLPTSTKDGITIQIDTCQITNIDIDKQNKDQMFRIPSTFIVVDENEPILIDLEMTLSFRGENSKGESIIEKLVAEYDSKKDIWSANPYQLTYTADHEFIRKLSLIFLEKKLLTLEKDAQKLNDKLDTLSRKEYDEEISRLRIAKEKEKQEKETQRYFSLLPEEFQNLERSLRLFKVRIKKDQNQQKGKEHKKQLEDSHAEFKAAKREEQGTSTIKTAKQRKEEYLKMKQDNMEPFSNTKL